MFYEYIDSSVTNELLYALSEEFTQYCDKTGDQLKIRQYMGKIKNPKDAASSHSLPPPPAPPTPTKSVVRGAVATVQEIVASPNYIPSSPAYNPVVLKQDMKTEPKKEKDIDLADSGVRSVSAMQLNPKSLPPPEGLSPPPLKRVKTEVLDLNQYKERRNILEIQQKLTPNNASNTPNSTSSLTPRSTS
uniref:Uncharacterized protein n=1 Tax=Romanomermis culicivorax TaxID=13658 RepID=A0A915KY11_ROMCU